MLLKTCWKIRLQRTSCSYISEFRDNNLDWHLTSKTTLDPPRESFVSAKAFFVVSEWKRSVLSAVLLGVRGGTYERKGRAKNKEGVPLLHCNREIAGHKSTWKIADVETEVELILARAAISTLPENIAQLTICPYHYSSLGIGWRSGSQRY